MSFKQMIWKMAKAEYNKYLFYFLCNSFAVMFFFMFATVYFNESVVQVKQSESIQYVLTIPGVALVVFTIFFIHYAHHIFIKKRKSEFSLLMTLGMSNRDISKLLLLENAVIGLFSLIAGLLAGMIFSRLFFSLLMNQVGIEGVSFQITGMMFLSSTAAFLLVFLIVVGKSLFLILTRDPIESMKSEQIRETLTMKSPLFGGIGVAILIGSIIGLYFTYGNPVIGGDYLIFWAIATFLGLYISLLQFASFIIELAKRSKHFYYQHILFWTNLDTKLKQLTSIFMLVTVMIMVTILYSTIILFSYMSAEKEAISQNPFDIAFVEVDILDTSLLVQKENQLQEHISIPLYSYSQKDTYYDWTNTYTFISVDNFNKLTSRKLSLENGEFLSFINVDPEHADGYEKNILFPIESERRNFELKDTIFDKRINDVPNLGEMIIVNGNDYASLKERSDGEEATLHLVNVENWKESGPFVKKIEERLKTGADDQDVVQIASKIEDYERQRNSNGILFYVSTFLSVLFFFGSFILLYLHLFSSVEREKEKYSKLRLIGITALEMKRIMTKEIATIFFIPTTIGTTLALLYVVAMAKDIGGITKHPDILLYFFIVAGVYYVIQIGFYLFAKRKMLFEILR